MPLRHNAIMGWGDGAQKQARWVVAVDCFREISALGSRVMHMRSSPPRGTCQGGRLLANTRETPGYIELDDVLLALRNGEFQACRRFMQPQSTNGSQ